MKEEKILINFNRKYKIGENIFFLKKSFLFLTLSILLAELKIINDLEEILAKYNLVKLIDNFYS